MIENRAKEFYIPLALDKLSWIGYAYGLRRSGQGLDASKTVDD